MTVGFAVSQHCCTFPQQGRYNQLMPRVLSYENQEMRGLASKSGGLEAGRFCGE